jgi:septum formation protein
MIILASASPRRKELLGKITSNFKIIPSTCDETIPDNIKAIEVAEYLSAQKAKDIFKDNKDDIVIGSDTTIVFNNKVSTIRPGLDNFNTIIMMW